jgi:hypothetical protein
MSGTSAADGYREGEIEAKYLDEFVFRHNQHGNPQAAFQTRLGLGTGRAPAPLSIVRGAIDLPQFPIRQ